MAFLPCCGIFLHLVWTQRKYIFCAEVGMELIFWRQYRASTLPESGKPGPAARGWAAGVGMAVTQPTRTADMGGLLRVYYFQLSALSCFIPC